VITYLVGSNVHSLFSCCSVQDKSNAAIFRDGYK